jgi:hypothetical protein
MGLVSTDVSEERVASIFGMERIRELETIAVISTLRRRVSPKVLRRPTRRHIPEDGSLHRHRAQTSFPTFSFSSPLFQLQGIAAWREMQGKS